MTAKRDILHITIGDDANGWTPTSQDMHELCQIFQEATVADCNAVVVPSQSVKCKLHSIEDGQHLRVVGVAVDAELLEHLRSTHEPVTVLATDTSTRIEEPSE